MSKTTIYQILQTLQDQKTNSNCWNITWTQGLLLSSIISLYEPKEILEIGTSNGFSTLWMLEGSPKSNITTIEINSDSAKQAKKNFSLANISDQINLIQDNVYDVLKNLNKNSYDAVFIDALQQEYDVLLENIFSNEVLNKNHMILFDNVISHKKDQYLVNLLNSKGYETIVFDEGSGLLFASYGL